MTFCVQAGCALIGGETAEHPGTMAPEEYDLAGFSVGIVDKAKVLDHNTMKAGDVILALPSSGIHSNGYSLVRKVFDVERADLGMYSAELGQTLGEALLTPTRIYVKPMLRCMEAVRVKGVSHITGGGFYENLPRCLPEHLSAKIDKAAIQTPAIFRLLQSQGGIPERDMFNTYNMGVGMTVIVSKEDADRALSSLSAENCSAYVEKCPRGGIRLRRRHESGGAAQGPGGRGNPPRRDRAGVRQHPFRLRLDPCCQPWRAGNRRFPGGADPGEL